MFLLEVGANDDVVDGDVDEKAISEDEEVEDEGGRHVGLWSYVVVFEEVFVADVVYRGVVDGIPAVVLPYESGWWVVPMYCRSQGSLST